MGSNEFLVNSALLVVAYAYILSIILVAGKLRLHKAFAPYSRKFLHMMIGNLVFIIPFFTFNSFTLNFPFFVAAPFILVTFFASAYSPFTVVSQKMEGLADITDHGHQTGLIFYALSYTVLAALFSAQPYLIAIGILPMSYGDAFASIVGQKYGKNTYHLFSKKSIEGSLAMFAATLLFVALILAFMSAFFAFPVSKIVVISFAVAAVAALAEAFTPLGFDNITVPALSVLTTLALMGGL
jgi:dolichol kinase